MTPSELAQAVELAKRHIARREEWPNGDVELFIADYDVLARALIALHERMPTDLVEARRAHNETRALVEGWMRAEGEQGHLRRNDEAPAWPKYEAALARWHEAVGELDRLLAAGGKT